MAKDKNINKDFIPWGKPYFTGEEKEYLLKALDSTWISGGEFVDRLEADFAGIISSKYAVSTSNCTTALHLALVAAGIGSRQAQGAHGRLGA